MRKGRCFNKGDWMDEIPAVIIRSIKISGPYLGFFVCGGKLGFREISDQYSYKKQPSKIRHYVRKKHLVFLAGATAPFAPPLCTALNLTQIKSTRRKQLFYLWTGADCSQPHPGLQCSLPSINTLRFPNFLKYIYIFILKIYGSLASVLYTEHNLKLQDQEVGGTPI